MDYMSSESEQESGDEIIYVVKTLLRRSESCIATLRELDAKADTIKSKRSKRQEAKMVKKECLSQRPVSMDVTKDNAWILK